MKTKENFRIKLKAMIILISYTVALGSCNVYRIKEVDLSTKKASIAAKNDNLTIYYVLHVGSNIWNLSNVKAYDTKLSGNLGEVDPKAMAFYKNAIDGGKMSYDKMDQNYVYQAHIFADEFKKENDLTTIDNSQITKLYVLDRNNGKSALIKGTVIAGSIVGGLGLFLLAACSCPHVYVYNGETYYFNNTLFTGATSPAIERSDFKIMPDYFPSSSDYKLKVVNEENEIQKIDLTELIVVEHAVNSQVIADQNGELYEVSNLISPISAIDDGNENLNDLLNYGDDESHDFSNLSAEKFSNVYANFKAPENKENAKLVLRVKNSVWLSYVYKSFTELFGKRYETWVKRNHKKTKEEVYAALKKEGIPLIVSIKNGDQWVDIETIHPVGDVSFNSIVVPIDKKLIQGNEIQVRIRSGFMFWKMDQISLDTTPKTQLSVQHILPNQTANNQNIMSDDEQYLTLENTDSISLTFSGLPVNNELKRTIILKSNGHYIPLMFHDGKPNRDELAKFKDGGELTNYSKRLYHEYFGELQVTFNN